MNYIKYLYYTGLLYLKLKKFDEAIDIFKLAADQGHIESQFKLGFIYHEKRDLKNAIEWYSKLAEQGHAKSQHNLACLYGKSTFVYNRMKSFFWYHKAAEQGLAPSQFSLGIIFYHGQGVKQDYGMALKWNNLSASQGFKPAIEFLKDNKGEEKCLVG